MCAAPAAAAALAVLFPIIFNHPFPFFLLTIVFLVIDIVTSARIASVCIEDVVVRINVTVNVNHVARPIYPRSAKPLAMKSTGQGNNDGEALYLKYRGCDGTRRGYNCILHPPDYGPVIMPYCHVIVTNVSTLELDEPWTNCPCMSLDYTALVRHFGALRIDQRLVLNDLNFIHNVFSGKIDSANFFGLFSLAVPTKTRSRPVLYVPVARVDTVKKRCFVAYHGV